MSSPASVNIVLADDHPLLRAGIVTALKLNPQFQVVGEAGAGDGVVELLQQHVVEILLLDLKMGSEDPCRLIRRCREIQPGLKVLVLSAYTDPDYLYRLRDVGIQGFVVKEEAPVSLVQAVRVVAAGETWFSQSVLHMLRNLAEALEVRLTDREEQVLQAISLGKNNQAIAVHLKISKETVRRYITSLYSKLGVRTRVEAVLWLDQRTRRHVPGGSPAPG